MEFKLTENTHLSRALSLSLSRAVSLSRSLALAGSLSPLSRVPRRRLRRGRSIQGVGHSGFHELTSGQSPPENKQKARRR